MAKNNKKQGTQHLLPQSISGQKGAYNRKG